MATLGQRSDDINVTFHSMIHYTIIDMKYNRSGSQSANSIFSAEESTKELYQVYY